MNELTPEQIQQHKNTIDEMPQMAMARLWRFAPSGHPYFDNRTDLPQYFNACFSSLGGFTPEISKAIGWSKLS